MKKLIEFIEKVKAKIKMVDWGTILRTALFYLSLANEVVACIGKTSFASAEWYQWLSLGLLAATGIVAWWYNNDYTNFAVIARDIFDALKDGVIEKTEIKAILEKIAEKKTEKPQTETETETETKPEEAHEEAHEETHEETHEEEKPVEETHEEEKPVEPEEDVFPVQIEVRNAKIGEYPKTVKKGEKFHVEIECETEWVAAAFYMGATKQYPAINGKKYIWDIEAVDGKITAYAVAK